MASQQPGSQFDGETLDAWVNGFQHQNQAYQNFLRTLADELLALKETNKRLDIENKNLVNVAERLTSLESDLNHNKFVGVLIDGDGMPFSKSLLVQGAEGGRNAAHGLITSTRDCLQDAITPKTKIRIFVLANATSLAQTLVQNNIIKHADTFHEFLNGFNSVDDLVTFTNVGRGKELVDTKIKGWSLSTEANLAMMMMFASWPQCQNIILGGSHDNGYARILSKLKTENVPPGKVRLLQGPPFAAELAQLSPSDFPRLEKFGDLFMASKLGQQRSSTYSQVASADAGVLKTPPKSPPMVAVSAATNGPSKRLPDKAVYLSLKQLKPHPCNNYYLLPGGCTKQESDCRYSHAHTLDDAQVAALRYYCKQNPCDSWQRSRYCPFGDDCIRGHDCPDAVKGKCSKADCGLAHPRQGSYV